MSQKKCIIVCGPTAVGKTDHAINLALKYSTPILSADSRQCYRELHIGVAKPSSDQLKSVSHYFINSHSIQDEVNVKVFERYALNSATQLFKEHDTAIMVGGTGMYIKAFAEGIDEIPEIDPAIREDIISNYKTKGQNWLYEEIEKTDPKFFGSGEMENPQRMLRALEVKLETGKSILDYQLKQKVQRDFDIEYVLLELPPEELYQKINKRVDNMMLEGLMQEAKSLYSFRHLNALQTVGYKELFSYMDGDCTLDFAVEEIKKNTRRYAKRQMTWFKKVVRDRI